MSPLYKHQVVAELSVVTVAAVAVSGVVVPAIKIEDVILNTPS